MSKVKSIRTKISAIKNTQKITRAMELVAASKMRKAQDRMALSRPYAEKIRAVLSHVAAAHTEYMHPYLKQPKVIRAVGYIVVSTDRGLCGGLNINLFRAFLTDMKAWQDQSVNIELCVIGRKAEAFFRRYGGQVLAVADHLGDAPKVQDIVGMVQVLLERYDQGQLDAIYLVSNEFVNNMVQRPVIHPLLPLKPDEVTRHWDYIYEPDEAKQLLTVLLTRYIESQLYQSVIENIACEQSARMVAMKNATDNAGELIDELNLIYNKARQAAITQEISEIIAGASAIA